MTLQQCPNKCLGGSFAARTTAVFTLAGLSWLPLLSQAPAPATERLDAAAIRKTGDDLLRQARTTDTGVAFTNLIARPGSTLQLAVRVRSGQAEWHREDADLLICVEGDAEVVTGGKVVDGKATAAGEIRGSAVDGGTRQHFGPGDILRIEPGTPHQFLLAPGATVRYLAVKSRPR